MKTLRKFRIILLVLLFSGACSALPGAKYSIEPSGSQIPERLDVRKFDRVSLIRFGDVIITQGRQESLLVTTD